ncbi:hypothetical protein F2Q69_00011144 [Brassica cretica]|uniref:Uncharacterized protein n=1 Tax=Brassica cretica TaxID=69181 RepID=A0A8S9R4P4_BRACR|nr:hypothetical protein F2Q69_00011144 [Brassica cretica]
MGASIFLWIPPQLLWMPSVELLPHLFAVVDLDLDWGIGHFSRSYGSDLNCLHETESRRRRLGARLLRLGLRGWLAAGFVGGGAAAARGGGGVLLGHGFACCLSCG